jgi:hypothetical protein
VSGVDGGRSGAASVVWLILKGLDVHAVCFACIFLFASSHASVSRWLASPLPMTFCYDVSSMVIGWCSGERPVAGSSSC